MQNRSKSHMSQYIVFVGAWDVNSLSNSVPKGSGCMDAMRKSVGGQQVKG